MVTFKIAEFGQKVLLLASHCNMAEKIKPHYLKLFPPNEMEFTWEPVNHP